MQWYPSGNWGGDERGGNVSFFPIFCILVLLLILLVVYYYELHHDQKVQGAPQVHGATSGIGICAIIMNNCRIYYGQ